MTTTDQTGAVQPEETQPATAPAAAVQPEETQPATAAPDLSTREGRLAAKKQQHAEANARAAAK